MKVSFSLENIVNQTIKNTGLSPIKTINKKQTEKSISPKKLKNEKILNSLPGSPKTRFEDTIINRNKSFNTGPYLSQEELGRIEYKKNKEKWLKKSGFDPYIGKLHMTEKLYVPNYVIVSKSKSIHEHKFREDDKDKNVDKNDLFFIRKSNDLLI
jgi:hypothetical protein